MPVAATGPLIFYTGVCVTGLAFYASARRRHPAWVAAGLVPVIGPLVALVAVAPRPKHGTDCQPPKEQPPELRFAYGMLWVVIALVGVTLVGKPAAILSLSPDKSLRVQLVPRPQFIDINFRIRVQRIDQFLVTSSEVIFDSPDEGGLQGRFIWAKDGSRFVLVGSKFYVNEKAILPNGEKLYLMYDVQSGQVWCNAAWQKKFPPFSPADLQDIEWNTVISPTHAVG